MALLFKSDIDRGDSWRRVLLELEPGLDLREWPEIGDPNDIEYALVWKPPQGELKTYTVTGTDGAHVTRGFCPTCGCQTMSYVEEMPAIRFVKAGTLEDSSWVTIDSSYWSCSAQPWSPVDASLPAFEKNPTM